MVSTMMSKCILTLTLTGIVTLSGCQHIQVARSPLPITLTPNAAQKAALNANTPTKTDSPIILTPTNSPIKNKSATKKVTDSQGFYLLESWF